MPRGVSWTDIGDQGSPRRFEHPVGLAQCLRSVLGRDVVENERGEDVVEALVVIGKCLCATDGVGDVRGGSCSGIVDDLW